MKVHQSKWMQCRNCKQRYIEGNNHANACLYHPGEYKQACPRSCPGFKNSCRTHYRKRWTCCDNTKEGAHGSTGCEGRHHVPEYTDVEYCRMVEEVEDMEDTATRRHLRDSEEITMWKEKARVARNLDVQKIIKVTAREREVVASHARIFNTVKKAVVQPEKGTLPESS